MAGRLAEARSPGGAGWWKDDVVYQVFPRSFADSNGDGIGDLRGLVARLDLLNDGDPATTDDLGVDALWLMPINASPSYHGYDVTDYRAVARDYGTLADADALLAAAHARGVRVILDLVINHTSREHPWFRAARDRAHPEHARYRDYYLWRSAPPAWKRPWDGAPVWHDNADGRWFYALFWSGMPDLNLENPAVQEELLGVMRFWLARGVDGFRLDAVRHLVESPAGALADVDGSHLVLRRLRAAIERDFPNVLLVGEAWSDTPAIARYAGDGDELHLAFSFEVAAAVLAAVNDDQRLPLAQALERAEVAFPDRSFEAPFLTNHDQQRAMRQLGGDAAKAALAAATLFALPGTPFVYYGEEVGMQGGASRDDEDKRTPMRFTRTDAQHGFTAAARAWHGAREAPGIDVETQQADGLWRTYQRLIALRHAEHALSTGGAARPVVQGGGRGAFALLRTLGAERVLFLANFHREAAPAFTVEVAGAPTVLLASGAPRVTSAGPTLVVDGLGARAWAFVRLSPAHGDQGSW
ncbi:MAG: hypothetical protein A2138_10595 [Deltaproteobacteria bacterium RBG_16_71_12]|nr:MAG: hypothetical protein A2138_10595 [Deltaproteobacteria bacterium RBG_16_71_12]